MPRRSCRSCSALLHAADRHSECVSCLGAAHAEAALKETECPHCEDMSLSSLRSRIAFFSERDSVPPALPLPASQEPVRKKQRGSGSQRRRESALTRPEPPRAILSPQREASPVLFARQDQRPSADASDMVCFSGSECDPMEEVMSSAASDCEELPGSFQDPAPLPSTRPSAANVGMDAELLRIMTIAIEDRMVPS